MARTKKSQDSIKKRTAEKRKQEDALLAGGTFEDVGELSAEISTDIYNVGRKKQRSSWDSEEQDYELRPRKLQDAEEGMVEGLPIKINGMVARNLVTKQTKHAVKKQEEEEEEEEEESDEEEETKGAGQKLEEEEEEEEPDTEETIIALKEEIADLVEKIMEDPEEHYNALNRLVKMAHSKNPNTCKFAMLALVPVFNSIIPGYRIRPLSEIEKKEKVSKEVARLRNFEQTLVINYRNYITHLAKLAKTPSNATPMKVTLSNLAMHAVNQLIPNVSHFNFITEVLSILVRRICKPSLASDPTAVQSIKTVESLFNADDEGIISVEIIRILMKVVKVRNYNIEESVLNTLLSLDVLHDYDPNTKEDNYQRPMKMKKKDRVHLSKKERKARKEMKEIDEEMRKAELAVSAEERERNQAEILKSVLALYLNVLKSGNHRLIGSVLEGLSKFGSMANFDLLGDFLEVMKEIIYDAELDNLSSEEVRKVLLCIVTAFALISNNSHMKINMDLSKFVDALYSLLPYVALDADIELSYKSLRLADPLNEEIMKPSVNVSTKAELLLKALDHVFFRSKSGTKERAAAFTKRLYMCMMHTPEKTTVALLKFLDKLMNRYPEIGGLYSTEDRIGNGKFNMEIDNISRCNPDAATLWENHTLSKHFCPTAVTGVRSLTKRSKEYSA